MTQEAQKEVRVGVTFNFLLAFGKLTGALETFPSHPPSPSPFLPLLSFFMVRPAKPGIFPSRFLGRLIFTVVCIDGEGEGRNCSC